MLIVACISGHGFGHGARTAAVLSALAALEPGWRIVLSTPLPADVLAVAMGPVPFLHRPCRWDVGVVQADALGADEAATLAALEQLERDLPLRIEQEAAWIAAQGQPVLVLGDVPPAAALLAARLGAPLVWLASFGWEAIYAPMGGPFLAWAEHCRALYARGQLLLRCPLALPIAWGLPEQPLGLVSARPRLDAAQLRRQLALPPDPERCVLVSFGGMGFQLDPALLKLNPDPRRARVEAVLDEFLDHRGRALDDLARGDLIGHERRQRLDPPARGRGSKAQGMVRPGRHGRL